MGAERDARKPEMRPEPEITPEAGLFEDAGREGPPDPRHRSAGAILSRLLVGLPLAARDDDGVEVESLARELGVPPRRLLRDFVEVDERGYYLHAGLGDQITVALDGERVRVRTTGEFRRPVGLTRGEALALELGMRAVADEDRDEMDTLSRRLLSALSAAVPPSRPPLAIPPAPSSGDLVRARVETALREGGFLELLYLAPGKEPEERRLLPGLLVHAEGEWYALGRDLDRGAPRIFRCDRILEARVSPLPPEVPPMDPEEQTRLSDFLHPGEGRVWMPPGEGTPQGTVPEEFPVRVRYDREIAEWIRERAFAGATEGPDGSLEVVHQVTDPGWVIRHVLGYGGSAELLEPAWLRERIRKAARALQEI
jgi:proteasome accessory factor C